MVFMLIYPISLQHTVAHTIRRTNPVLWQFRIIISTKLYLSPKFKGKMTTHRLQYGGFSKFAHKKYLKFEFPNKINALRTQ